MITVLVVRDPDSSDEIRVWDGDTELLSDRVHIAYVDAGAGWEYEDWVASAEAETVAVPHPVPRRYVAEAYADPPGIKYIDNWPEEEYR